MIILIAFLCLLDVLTTLYGVYCAGGFVEEVGPLAGPNHSINNMRVAGSLVFSVLVLIFVLFFNLWQYKIIKILLLIWLIRCIATIIINSYAIYTLLSPISY
jgi:hypothetical protein